MYSVYRINENLFCAAPVEVMEGARALPVSEVKNKDVFREFLHLSGEYFPTFRTLHSFILSFNMFM